MKMPLRAAGRAVIDADNKLIATMSALHGDPVISAEDFVRLVNEADKALEVVFREHELDTTTTLGELFACTEFLDHTVSFSTTSPTYPDSSESPKKAVGT